MFNFNKICEKYPKGENMQNYEWLKNKRVIIVGASDGIGKYLALKLILQFKCYVLGISNNQKQMEQFSEKLEEFKDNFTFEIFDATNEKAWQEFATKLSENKTKIDVLINCVGELPEFKRFENYTQKDLNKTISANFFSCVFSIRHILPFLKQSNEPAIVNISCLSASLSVGGTSIYSASKSALKSYTQILGAELDDKFYVSLVLLGTTNTNFYKNQNGEVIKKLQHKAMPPRKASQIIIDGMCKKKRRIVVGFKTYALDGLCRMFPSLSVGLIKRWLKHKKINLLQEENKQ